MNTAEELGISNARLRAVINIGRELASEPDVDRLLDSVCAAARDLFCARYATLGLVDPETRRLQRVVSCGNGGAGGLTIGEAITGTLAQVIVERKALHGHDSADGWSGAASPSGHQDVGAFVVAPLASPSRVYGWLCLVGADDVVYTANDQQLLHALAGLLGRIYESSDLAASSHRRADEFERERDRAQRYLDIADVILLALDLDGRITLINNKGCMVLGWTERELLGRSFLDTCLPIAERDALRQRFSEVVAGDLSIVEAPLLTRFGTERLIEWHNTLMKDRDGTVCGTFSSGTDITRRVQAAEAQKIAEERMRFAVQGANVGIWDMNYTTGQLRWSAPLEAQYGLAAGAFEGTFDAFAARVHPDDRAGLLAALEEAQRTGRDFTVQHRIVRADGAVRWLTGAGHIHLDSLGAPLRGVGISIDVTDQRSLEEQFRQAQKMEAVGQLAAGVAHDFNNLLTAILGYSELLLADMPPGEQPHRDVLEIQQAGLRAVALTKQLLAFSRKEIVKAIPLDLNVVVANMRSLLARLIRDDVTVNLTLHTRPAAMTADRGHIEQIVMNLALNARDAMPTGGTLTIAIGEAAIEHARPTAASDLSPGLYVRLTVTDTGTGMTPEVRARLFQAFFTTKPSGQGTGLGLATVLGIAQECGAGIEVDSEIGRGTTFTIYFPCTAGPAAPVQPAAVIAHRSGRHQVVLVVDDAEGIRELASRLLRRRGYDVLTAANAEDAALLFAANPTVNLLLTDVVMPGASGPELMGQLLRDRPSLRVIYMSGYNEEIVARHGVSKTSIAFLHKPFTSDALDRAIREALGEEHHSASAG